MVTVGSSRILSVIAFALKSHGAGDENRTRVLSLGGSGLVGRRSIRGGGQERITPFFINEKVCAGTPVALATASCIVTGSIVRRAPYDPSETTAS
jgi:hypothetical protein